MFSFSIGAIKVINEDNRCKIITKAGNRLPISHPEYLVLEKLSNERDHVVSKEELSKVGWRREDVFGHNNLAVAISNLRKVLSFGDAEIINVPRKGYKLIIKPTDMCIGENKSRDKEVEVSKFDILKKESEKKIYKFNGKFFLMISLIFFLSVPYILFMEFSLNVTCDRDDGHLVCSIYSCDHLSHLSKSSKNLIESESIRG